MRRQEEEEEEEEEEANEGGGVDEGDGWKDSRTSLLRVLDSCAPLVVLAY